MEQDYAGLGGLKGIFAPRAGEKKTAEQDKTKKGAEKDEKAGRVKAAESEKRVHSSPTTAESLATPIDHSASPLDTRAPRLEAASASASLKQQMAESLERTLQKAQDYFKNKEFETCLKELNDGLLEQKKQLTCPQQADLSMLHLQVLVKLKSQTDNAALHKALITFNNAHQQLLFQSGDSSGEIKKRIKKALALTERCEAFKKESGDTEVGHVLILFNFMANSGAEGSTQELLRVSNSTQDKWVGYWKGCVLLKKTGYRTARELLRKAWDHKLPGARERLAECLCKGALDDLHGEFSGPVSADRHKEMTKELLEAVELGETGALCLLTERAKLGLKGFPINTETADSYIDAGLLMDDVLCHYLQMIILCNLDDTKDHEVMQRNVSHSIDTLQNLYRLRNRHRKHSAPFCNPVQQWLQGEGEPENNYTGFCDYWLTERYKACKANRRLLQAYIMESCELGSTGLGELGITHLLHHESFEVALCWAAAAKAITGKTIYDREVAIKMLDRRASAVNSRELKIFAADIRLQYDTDRPSCSVREPFWNFTIFQNARCCRFFEQEGHLGHAASTFASSKDHRCLFQRCDRIRFKHLMLLSNVGLDVRDHIVRLATDGYTEACIYLARDCIQLANYVEAGSWLDKQSVKQNHQTRLLKAACCTGKPMVDLQPGKDIRASFRLVDMVESGRLKAPKAKELRKHLMFVAMEMTQQECRHLRPDPGAQVVASMLKSLALSHSDQNKAIHILYRAFWLTGNNEIAIALTKRFDREGRQRETWNIRRVLCNETDAINNSAIFNYEAKTGFSVFSKRQRREPVELHGVAFQKGNKFTALYLSGIMECWHLKVKVNADTSPTTLGELYRQGSTLAEHYSKERENFRATAEQQNTLGAFFHKLAMVCHYSGRLSEAYDYLQMSACIYKYEEARLPLIMYCWDRGNTRLAEEISPPHAKSPVVRKWSAALADRTEISQHITPDFENWEDFQHGVAIAKKAAEKGNPARLIKLYHDTMEKLVPLTTKQEAWGDAVVYERQLQILIQLIVGLKITEVIPILMMTLYTGTPKYFPISPYKTLSLIAELKGRKGPANSILSAEIPSLDRDPAPLSYDFFQSSLIVLLRNNSEPAVKEYIHLLQRFGLLDLKEYGIPEGSDYFAPDNDEMVDLLVAITQGDKTAGKRILRLMQMGEEKRQSTTMLLCQLQVYAGHEIVSKEILDKNLVFLADQKFKAASTCLGVIRLREGKKGEALEYFRKAGRGFVYDPDAAQLALNLAHQLHYAEEVENKKHLLEAGVPSAVCQKACTLIENNKHKAALKLLDVPWVSTNPEAAAMIALLRLAENPDDSHCQQHVRDIVAKGDPRALFRLLVLTDIHQPVSEDVFKVPDVVAALSAGVNNECSQFLQTDPYLVKITDLLRIEATKALLGQSEAVSSSGKNYRQAIEQLLCVLNHCKLPEAWQLPAGKSLARAVPDIINGLMKHVQQYGFTDIAYKVLTQIQGSGKKLLPVDDYLSIIDSCKMTSEAECKTLIKKISQESNAETLLKKALKRVVRNKPVNWIWASCLFHRIIKDTAHASDYTLVIEQAAVSAIQALGADIEPPAISAIQRMFNFLSHGAAIKLVEDHRDQVLSAVVRCTAANTCHGAGTFLAQTLEDTGELQRLPMMSSEEQDKVIKIISAWYQCINNEDKAQQWLLAGSGNASEEAIKRIDQELTAQLDARPVDQGKVKALYQKVAQTCPQYPGVPETTLISSMNAAAGDESWLLWLAGIKVARSLKAGSEPGLEADLQESTPLSTALETNALEKKACVNLVWGLCQRGKNVEAFKRWLKPALINSKEQEILGALVHHFLSQEKKPWPRLTNLLASVDADMETNPEWQKQPFCYIRHIPVSGLPAFINQQLESVVDSARCLKVIQQVGLRDSECLTQLPAKTVVSLLESIETDKRLRTKLQDVVFQTNAGVLKQLSPTAHLKILAQFAHQCSTFQEAPARRYLKICQAVALEHGAEKVMVYAGKIPAGFQEGKLKKEYQALKNLVPYTVNLSNPEQAVSALKKSWQRADTTTMPKQLEVIVLKCVEEQTTRLRGRVYDSAHLKTLDDIAEGIAIKRAVASLRANLSQWQSAKPAAKVLLLKEFKASEALTERISPEERTTLAEVHAWPEREEKRLHEAGNTFQATTTLGAYLDEYEKLQVFHLPADYPGKSDLKPIMRRKERELVTFFRQQMKYLQDKTQAALAEDTDLQSELKDALTLFSRLETHIMPRLEPTYRNSIKAMQSRLLKAQQFWVQRVMLTQMEQLLTVERFPTLVREKDEYLELYKNDLQKIDLEACDNAGSRKRRLGHVLDLIKVDKELLGDWEHKAPAIFQTLVRLFMSQDFDRVLKDYGAQYAKQVWPVVRQLTNSAETLSKRNKDLCERLLKTLLATESVQEEQARTNLACFYTQIGEQKKASIETNRLASASHVAAMDTPTAMASAVAEKAEKLHQVSDQDDVLFKGLGRTPKKKRQPSSSRIAVRADRTSPKVPAIMKLSVQHAVAEMDRMIKDIQYDCSQRAENTLKDKLREWGALDLTGFHNGAEKLERLQSMCRFLPAVRSLANLEVEIPLDTPLKPDELSTTLRMLEQRERRANQTTDFLWVRPHCRMLEWSLRTLLYISQLQHGHNEQLAQEACQVQLTHNTLCPVNILEFLCIQLQTAAKNVGEGTKRFPGYYTEPALAALHFLVNQARTLSISDPNRESELKEALERTDQHLLKCSIDKASVTGELFPMDRGDISSLIARFGAAEDLTIPMLSELCSAQNLPEVLEQLEDALSLEQVSDIVAALQDWKRRQYPDTPGKLPWMRCRIEEVCFRLSSFMSEQATFFASLGSS